MQRLLVSLSFPWVRQQCPAAWFLRSCSFLHRKNSSLLMCLLLVLLGLLPRPCCGAEAIPLATLRVCRVVPRWAVFLSSSSSRLRSWVRAWLTRDRIFSLRLVVLAMGVATMLQPAPSSLLSSPRPLSPLPCCLPFRYPRTSRATTTTSVGQGRCLPKGNEPAVDASHA